MSFIYSLENRVKFLGQYAVIEYSYIKFQIKIFPKYNLFMDTITERGYIKP